MNLQRVQMKLTEMAKRPDRTRDLPAEILISILLRLPSRQRIQCARLSRRWKETIYYARELWTEIDLLNRTQLTNDHVKQAVFMCRDRLRTLRLPASPHLSGAALRSICLNKIRWLESLELTPSSRISEESFIAVLDETGKTLESLILHTYGNWARHVWTRCPRLRCLVAYDANGSILLKGCRGAHLETLRLPNCADVWTEQCIELIQHMPALKTLSMPGATGRISMNILLHLCTLQHLEAICLPKLEPSPHAREIVDTFVKQRPPNLQHLDLSYAACLEGTAVTRLVQGMGNALRTLRLSYIPHLDEHSLHAAFQSGANFLGNIEELRLDYCPRIGNEILFGLARHARHLRYLSIRGNPRISDAGIHQLLKPTATTRFTLTTLDVSSCPAVRGVWADSVALDLADYPPRVPRPALKQLILVDCPGVSAQYLKKLTTQLGPEGKVIFRLQA
jgi:hypothetical protein